MWPQMSKPRKQIQTGGLSKSKIKDYAENTPFGFCFKKTVVSGQYSCLILKAAFRFHLNKIVDLIYLQILSRVCYSKYLSGPDSYSGLK